jgi:hypothetical protein
MACQPVAMFSSPLRSFRLASCFLVMAALRLLMMPALGALHVVDIGLVHGPGVDAAFGAVFVVDRAAVKTEGFGLAVELACIQPGLARGFEAFVRGLAMKACTAFCSVSAPASVSS